jgi:cobalamin biosynthesis Co2+ chelatase CbiK
MNDIYQHLSKVEKRPGMYMWNKNIIHLRSYIAWYKSCLRERWIEENEKPTFSEFNDWVKDYYNYDYSTSWWCNMILENSKDEEDALNTFFELLEKFKDEEWTKTIIKWDWNTNGKNK